jgi:hypothetical protein
VAGAFLIAGRLRPPVADYCLAALVRQEQLRGPRRPGDTHGHADVSLLERGSIVDAVSGRGDDLAEVLEPV